MNRQDRWAHLTCGFRRTEQNPECGAQPQWRLTLPLRRDWDPGLSPFMQQYACDAHFEQAIAQYGERGVEVVFEPLDDLTASGTPLVESRRPGQPLSERMNWIMTRVEVLTRGPWMRGSGYMQAAREWFAEHPQEED